MDVAYAAMWIALLIFLASVISVEAALSAAIIEIALGVLAGNFLGLHPAPWMDFLAGFGGILLTFLAGAEVDPAILKNKFKESLLIGGCSFLVPYLAAIGYCYWVADWTWQASLIAGCALSTTSLAVVYAVLVESGLTDSTIGKIIMASTFVTDMGTALALSLTFARFFLAIPPLRVYTDKQRATLLVLNSDEQAGDALKGWGKPFDDARFLVGVYPRGGIPGSWTRKSPPNYVERSCVLCGTTIDAGRVRDVASAPRPLDDKANAREWRVVGRGQAGIIAAYAALLDSSIKEVIIIDPPTSHRDGPHFLNVMRVLDIPDALGLLAPRPLTLINAKDKAFDRTAEIYKLAGAADKLKRE